MIRARAARLRSDRRGVSAVEFGFVAPVMVMVLMGLGEVLYQPYVQSILTGAVQKAGRDSSIEDSILDQPTTDLIDAKVEASVRQVAKDAVFKPTRLSYSSFALIKPERIYDANGNNAWDSGECFDDVNGNKTWDTNPGRAGQGGADDVTVYTMTVTYPRLFPVTKILGFSETQTIAAQTVLKNQPFDEQKNTTVEKVCP